MELQLYIQDFKNFVWKQAYASIFGGLLLISIIITRYYYPLDGYLARYDLLLIIALIIQAVLIIAKLEQKEEIFVIALFHILAMGMEIFKTHPSIGSWQYPESFSIGILGVPLFAGFMYSAVGSYLARVSRIFDFRYHNHPKIIYTITLISISYINFFTHHFIYDFRYFILLGIVGLFGKTRIYFKPSTKYYSMNLCVGFFLVALFIWIAENIATSMRVWVYPNQILTWHIVGYEKILSWLILMVMSFVLISIVNPPKELEQQ